MNSRSCAFVEGLNFQPFAFRGFTGKRRTVSFGWRYDFNGGGFQPSEPMPDAIKSSREAAGAAAGIEPRALEQCSIIEYAPGAGIGWHRDRPQFGKVVGVSLLAPCRMRFRRERDGGGWERAAIELDAALALCARRRGAQRLAAFDPAALGFALFGDLPHFVGAGLQVW